MPSASGHRGWTMAPPRNVVKIAVQMSDAIPQLIQLDQAKPLATVLKEVCDA